MDLSIQGRVALICGASAGLGLACAKRLAQEGAQVALCGRHPVRLQAACDQILEEIGVSPLPLTADLSRPEEIERLHHQLIEQFGRIEILIHNGGGPAAGNFFEHSDSRWQEAYDLVLMSFVRLCRLMLPVMEAQRWGRVVSITSRAAREPTPDLVLSAAFRAGISAVVHTLARQMAGANVLINAVLPGPYNTDRLQELLVMQAERQGMDALSFIQQSAQELPAGRFGEPEELAAVVAMLVSERNGYLTGASIPIDGGAMMGVW